MNVIGWQWDLAWKNKAENFDRVRQLLESTSVSPGSLIVLPEMFATGFSMNVADIAEADDGPTSEFLTSLSSEYGCAVIGGRVTKGPDGLGRNEALVVDPTGRVAARYHKLHPFSYGGESKHYAAGERLPIFEHAGFKIAVFVCYDLRFPEVFRLAVQAGAQVLVVIANWPAPRELHWTTLLQARAIENQAYVIGVNRTGSDPKLQYSGRSLIIDPRGMILADGGSSEGVVEAELNLQLLLDYRQQFPALADLRPQLLGTIPH